MEPYFQEHPAIRQGAALNSFGERLGILTSIQAELAAAAAEGADVLSLVPIWAQRLTGSDGAGVGLLDGEDLVYVTVSEIVTPFHGIRVPHTPSLSGLCLDTDKPLCSSDTANDLRVDRASTSKVGIRSMIVVPLYQHPHLIGVLNACSLRADNFNSEDVQLLQLLAGNVLPTLAQMAAQQAQANLNSALEESEERFRLAFDRAPIGMAIIGTNMRFARVNEALCTMLHYTEEELKQRTFMEITHPEDIHAGVEQVQQMFAGEIPYYRTEKRYFDKYGRLVWVYLTATVVRREDGTPLYAMGMMENISERKQAEQELAKKMLELERSNTDLDQFASVASHDLQEPLRKIQMFAGRLQKRLGDHAEDDVRDYTERMIGASQRMQALIEGLLAYSRVTSQAKAFADVDLNQVLAGVLSDLETRLVRTEGEVRCMPLPTMKADALQMRQLFQNLISNALKFRGAAPPLIRIEVCRQADVWQFTFADNGIGIPAEQSEMVFLLFHRLHGKSEYPGTGLGLAICKKIVERHGGRIWVESAEDTGSAFHFTLPAE